VCGCPGGCPGCSNPELWKRRSEFEISVSELVNLIKKIAASHTIDGFTITGGEPMAQPEELAGLITRLKPFSADILLYTGYKYEDLRRQGSDSLDEILNSVAVLIDGRYIEKLHTDGALKGSKNQNVIILNPGYKDCYENYLAAARNQIQNFTTSDGVVSVGIHRRNFASEIYLRINAVGGSNNND
jgi:anaerobic ribonucleoside-triphosphate reductase activating protein